MGGLGRWGWENVISMDLLGFITTTPSILLLFFDDIFFWGGWMDGWDGAPWEFLGRWGRGLYVWTIRVDENEERNSGGYLRLEPLLHLYIFGNPLLSFVFFLPRCLIPPGRLGLLFRGSRRDDDDPAQRGVVYLRELHGALVLYS
ncbi:hypothetical protein B0T18DRAFT_96412 [Schizothecium vesticola]|uniref:Transmembrane protein n=1 Tax=Schizothecium vesticola TaxID=314040 RepID=A0AA40K7P4_9PEZI|nr:hypothetical protein B0T18DRAFT_96412 [Schizothecium vesticola]